jgi:hypothetical protein
MNIGARLQELIRFLVITAVFLVVSRIFFDLLAGRPMFWTSEEGMQLLLWHSLVGGPFVLFALLVAAQRAASGNKPQ